MKVVHLVTSTNVGGAQVMLQRYLGALGPSAPEHSVISLASTGSIGRALASNGISVSSLDLAPGRPTPRALMRLRRLLRRSSPDIVHGWMYHGCLASWAALKGRGDPPAQLWSIHHSLQDIRKEKRATQMVVRALAALSARPEAITYCSGVARTHHEEIGFSPKRSSVIPNAVDTQLFLPDPAAKARLAEICGVPEKRILVTNVARSHPMKDHVSMIRATAELLARGHDVQAVLIGEGHSDGPAVALARSLGIAERVSALDVRDDIHDLVPGADIFLLTSAWGEAFSLAVLEAMSCCVPCIVTDVGDCAILVGEAGLVVPPGDPLAQADAVEQLLHLGPEGRARLGASARERVQAHFSTAHYVERHDALYRSILPRSGAAP